MEILRAAVAFVKKRGGKIIEGYPMEPKSGPMPDTFVWTGLLNAFLKAGFHEVPRWSENRPLVRFELP